MPRYYFHIEDHRTTLDEQGVELRDLEAARQEAAHAAGDMLRNGSAFSIWHEKGWRMWVTDQPGGRGRTLFTLRISAVEG